MSRIARLIKIFRVASRYRLDTFADEDRLPRSSRLLLQLGPWRLRALGDASRGERLRRALEDLGPVFIKFGQMLSTRRDLLPTDIADELAKLQDDVPPFDGEQAVSLVEQALGQSIEKIYAEFDVTPMASASVAQVHSATLHTGEQVVVKVVRPGIEKTIRQDIALLFTLARLVKRYLPDGWRLRPVEVVAEYELTILDELELFAGLS